MLDVLDVNADIVGVGCIECGYWCSWMCVFDILVLDGDVVVVFIFGCCQCGCMWVLVVMCVLDVWDVVVGIAGVV